MLIAYVQMSLVNTHADLSSKDRGLNSSLFLHLHPYFMYVRRKGSGESALVGRLDYSLAARNLLSIKISCAGLFTSKEIECSILKPFSMHVH